jgi:hypothetical protein
MSYIGKEPGEHFTSFQTETFSVSATTSYTLSHAVANENELALFVNNVRQQPGSGKAYTASGTALTLSAATASTDTMYAIYLGRALQTITPATNSITSAMLASGTATTLSAGAGITGGSGTIYKSEVVKLGDIIRTNIIIDLTGLNSSAAGDIIGKQATASCHLGQITAAVNGTILFGEINCLETPAGGEPDIDVYTATVSTGTEDVAISGLTETALLNTGADWTLTKDPMALTTVPPANGYLYLVGSGGGTDATYTAGKFLISLWGY